MQMKYYIPQWSSEKCTSDTSVCESISKPEPKRQETLRFSFQTRNEDTEWVKGCYTGELKCNFSWENDRDDLLDECCHDIKAIHLGGRMVLIQPKTQKSLEEVFVCYGDWINHWFTFLTPWEPAHVCRERCVWIRLHAWNKRYFDRLALMFGSLVEFDPITESKSYLALTRIRIRTSDPDLINRSITSSIDGVQFNIRVYEELEDTNPIFSENYLKPSNILLGHEMNACVGDFGVSKIVSNIEPSYESSSSIGTLGYIPQVLVMHDPLVYLIIMNEYGTSHYASTQGDVYSYGIILLEMFTNTRPTDHRSFEGHLNLHCFVRAAMPDAGVVNILDPLIQTEPNITRDKLKDCLVSILRIGLSCSKDIPRDRISIVEAVNELQKIQKKLRG